MQELSWGTYESVRARIMRLKRGELGFDEGLQLEHGKDSFGNEVKIEIQFLIISKPNEY